jgi:hypothetical protein
MAKRKKWSIQRTLLVTKTIRDSEFAEILADLGQLIYDELSSQPGSDKSINSSIATISDQSAHPGTTRKKVVNV